MIEPYTEPQSREMTWALEEFYAAVEEEFPVTIGNSENEYLVSPSAVIEFIVEQTTPTDGMKDDEYREHVSAVIGELMARTLGITRYSESQRFIEDLHVR